MDESDCEVAVITALSIIASSAITAAPAECTDEYLLAVSGNAMSWFCQRWDLGDLEFTAKSQMDLYRKVASKVYAGEVYDIRRFADSKTVLVWADAAKVRRFFARNLPKIPFDQCVKRLGTHNGYDEYEWRVSPTSQGLVKAMVLELNAKAGPQ